MAKMTNPTPPNTEGNADRELERLFNMAINAKETAVRTADAALEFADNAEIAREANKLLERYRDEFAVKVLTLIRNRELALLSRIKEGCQDREHSKLCRTQLALPGHCSCGVGEFNNALALQRIAIDNIAKEIRGEG